MQSEFDETAGSEDCEFEESRETSAIMDLRALSAVSGLFGLVDGVFVFFNASSELAEGDEEVGFAHGQVMLKSQRLILIPLKKTRSK